MGNMRPNDSGRPEESKINIDDDTTPPQGRAHRRYSSLQIEELLAAGKAAVFAPNSDQRISEVTLHEITPLGNGGQGVVYPVDVKLLDEKGNPTGEQILCALKLLHGEKHDPSRKRKRLLRANSEVDELVDAAATTNPTPTRRISLPFEVHHNVTKKSRNLKTAQNS